MNTTDNCVVIVRTQKVLSNGTAEKQERSWTMPPGTECEEEIFPGQTQALSQPVEKMLLHLVYSGGTKKGFLLPKGSQKATPVE